MAEPEQSTDGPKQGRRAGRRAGLDEDSKAGDAPPPRRRAADGSEIAGGRTDAPSGWGDPGPNASAFPQRPVAKPLPDADDEDLGGAAARRRGKRVPDEPAEEVVSVIRDTDEETPDDLATRVAEAPRNAGAWLSVWPRAWPCNDAVLSVTQGVKCKR
jgi:hypothetical protein